jgi:hypothetical protein
MIIQRSRSTGDLAGEYIDHELRDTHLRIEQRVSKHKSAYAFFNGSYFIFNIKYDKCE